jgi:hypothetical protein
VQTSTGMPCAGMHIAPRVRLSIFLVLLACTTPRESPADSSPPAPQAESGRADRVLHVGVSELSGLAAVRGGFMVADDELVGSVVFVPDAAGAGAESPAEIVKFDRSRKKSKPLSDALRLFPIQDVEGIASDGAEAVFVLGSHQPKKDARRTDREFLIRLAWDPTESVLRVKGDSWEQYGLIDMLGRVLEAGCATPASSPCIPFASTATTVDARFNLEGLAYDAESESLYVGFRGPLTSESKAIVVQLPESSARSGEPTGARVLSLELNGAGVASLEWDPGANRLLVLSGPEVDSPDARSEIFSFDPASGAVEQRYTFAAAAVGANRRPEGIALAPDGKLWIVFDDADGVPALRHHPAE